MADTRLRDLERRALEGDPLAQQSLDSERERLQLMTLWILRPIRTAKPDPVPARPATLPPPRPFSQDDWRNLRPGQEWNPRMPGRQPGRRLPNVERPDQLSEIGDLEGWERCTDLETGWIWRMNPRLNRWEPVERAIDRGPVRPMLVWAASARQARALAAEGTIQGGVLGQLWESPNRTTCVEFWNDQARVLGTLL